MWTVGTMRWGRGSGNSRSPPWSDALFSPQSPGEWNGWKNVFHPPPEIEAYRRTQISGSPNTVREKMESLAEATRADEVMVTAMVYDHKERLASYERLAEAFRLEKAA